MRDFKGANRQTWVRIAAVLVVGSALALVGWFGGWFGAPAAAAAGFQDFSEWLAPHWRAWYAMPIVALAGFGYQLTNILHSPSPMTVLGAVVIVGIPLTRAWFINRALRQPGRRRGRRRTIFLSSRTSTH